MTDVDFMYRMLMTVQLILALGQAFMLGVCWQRLKDRNRKEQTNG